MKTIKFQPYMTCNGKLFKRECNILDKVSGYGHSENYNIHIFRRGKIGYIIDTNSPEFTFNKYDYSIAKYLEITYNECYKFVDIQVSK